MNEQTTEQPAVGEERPFADRVAEMSLEELRRRVLTQREYIEDFCACIDGFGLHNGIDGHRLPGDVRAAVAGLVRAAAANSDKAPLARKTAFDSSAWLGEAEAALVLAERAVNNAGLEGEWDSLPKLERGVRGLREGIEARRRPSPSEKLTHG